MKRYPDSVSLDMLDPESPDFRADAHAMAAQLIPERPSIDPFWIHEARRYLAGALMVARIEEGGFPMVREYLKTTRSPLVWPKWRTDRERASIATTALFSTQWPDLGRHAQQLVADGSTGH